MSAKKDYELKKILTKVIDEGKKITDKDIEFLVIQFREKFGFSHGIALNPLLLLEDIEIGEALDIERKRAEQMGHNHCFTFLVLWNRYTTTFHLDLF